MRKNFVLLIVVAAVLILPSCSNVVTRRTVEIEIPSHPWEKASGTRLWYTLKWTDGPDVRALYIGPEQRRVKLEIPSGETVIIAAYPLGELNPFGGAVTSLDNSPTLVLSQNEGPLADELLSLDREVTRELNYGLLLENMLKKCDDLRQIGRISVIRDMQNRQLRDTSIKVVSLFGIDAFTLPNGIWTSEYLRDPDLIVTDNTAGPLELPEGVFHFLNTDLDRILVLIVDSRGDSYSYLRQSIV